MVNVPNSTGVVEIQILVVVGGKFPDRTVPELSELMVVC